MDVLRDGLLEHVLRLLEGVAEGARAAGRGRRPARRRRRGRRRGPVVVEEGELLGRDRAPLRALAAQI